VNLFGTFEFSDEEFIVDMAALVARYDDESFWKQATQGTDDEELT